MSQHITHINELIRRASIQEGDYASQELAAEIVRLRSVIAYLAPFMVRAVEETVAYAEELEESGVDPTEPALAKLNDTINRLRIAFKS